MLGAILGNQIAAYNLSIGTLIQLLRSIAAGRKGYSTPVGIDTFVDPRLGGGKVNAATIDDICRLVEFEGEA